MTIRRPLPWVMASCVVWLCGVSIVWGETGKPATSSRWATYDAATGERFYALSLKAELRELASSKPMSHVVVLIDTSASQSGLTRTDGLGILRAMVENFPSSSQLAIAACDVETHDLSQGWQRPEADQIQAALKALDARVPLGTTDLEAAFRHARQLLDGKSEGAIVYIGDGIARSHVLDKAEFKELIDDFVTARVSVSSLAIGPVLNVEGLATIANHTGGQVFVRQEISGTLQQIGQGLVQASMEPVLWVSEATLPVEFQQHLPKAFPPLRADRDSILIGMQSTVEGNSAEQLPIRLKGWMRGQEHTLEWNVRREASHPDFAFLSTLIEKNRSDEGLYLPTAGSDALRSVMLSLSDAATQLIESGRFALQAGDIEGAMRIAEEALARDPNNLEAKNLKDAIQRKIDSASLPRKGRFVQVSTGGDVFGGAVAETTAIPATEAPAPVPPPVPAPVAVPPAAPPPPVPASPFPPANNIGGIPSELATAGDLLAQEEGIRRLQAEQIETATRVRLQEAEALMARDPVSAEASLKLLLSDIRRAGVLEPGARSRLEGMIRANVETASRRAAIYRDQAARAEEVASNASATERILADRERSTAAVQQLVERFNALMDQQLYAEANNEIAPVINKLLPDATIARTVEVESSIAANYQLNQEVIYAKRRGFIDVANLVEKISIPFADEPPVVYPPADVWRALSARRLERYGSIDLAAGTSPTEKRIYSALKDTVTPEFNQVPLRNVIETFAQEKQIPIILDTKAMEGGTATPEDPVTLTNVPEISLRSALRLILDPLELTYVIEDEVMKITTSEQGSAQVLRIYPVGDLVIPIMSGGGGGGMMGGMGGGMMGGMGGGMGGMGGGMGGMGGGMGGMGGGMGGGMMGGMGGGGGVFAVTDVPSKDEAALTSTAAIEKPVDLLKNADELIGQILVTEDLKQREALEQKLAVLVNDRLAKAKELLAQKQTDAMKPEFQSIIDMISLALQRGAPQPWMYEALSLSMQMCDYPPAEIRRVLLSAVDFSGDVEDAIKIGKYLAKQGMHREALSVLRDAARTQPLRADIYEIALPLAIQLEDVPSLQWTCVGVLSNAWPDDHAKLVEQAELAAKAALIRLVRDGRVMESKVFEEQLKDSVKRDVVVRVSWTGHADIDLSVEEPSGTVCSLSNPRTPSGGILLNDGNANDKGSIDGYAETYACPEGFSGEYRILVERIWGEVAGGKVTIDILTDAGTPDQSYRREQIPLGEKDALVKIGVKHGRRKTPLVDISVAKSQVSKLVAGRSVLAQQLNSLGDVTSSLNGGNNGTGGIPGLNSPFFNPFRGAVGYRPIITVLPQGTMFFTNAVISGDRRYVRITPFPFFSDIVQVDTFNFITGGSSTQSGNLTGGGGGAGGGFGGGGNF